MLNIVQVPVRTDNYAWIVHADGSAVVIDPGAPEPVARELERRALVPNAILLTHHHIDHTEGVGPLLRQWPCPVHGPADPRMPMVTETVGEGDRVTVGCLQFDVWALPGHTQTQVGFLQKEAVWCGDALFSGGCGRLLGGSMSDLHDSVQRLAGLPLSTQIFCGHEYTATNLAFAAAVDPENEQLDLRRTETERLRAADEPTVPTSVATERAINPFLRTQSTAIRRTLRLPGATSLAIFSELRRRRDCWQG